MRACFAPTCCAVAGQERDRRATTLQCNIKRTFSSHFTLHSSHPAFHASHLHFTFHSSPYFKSSAFFSPHVTSSDLFSSHPITALRLLQLQLQNSYSYKDGTLHYTTLDCTRVHYTTLHYIARRSLEHHNYNCNCTTLITLHHNFHYITTTIRAALHHATSSRCG